MNGKYDMVWPILQRDVIGAANGRENGLTRPQLAREVLRLRDVISERDLQLRKMKEKMDNMAKDICTQKKEIEDQTERSTS